PAEPAHALGDRARRDEHHAAAVASQRRDLLGPARDCFVVEAAAVVRDETRADLDDETSGLGNRRAHRPAAPSTSVASGSVSNVFASSQSPIANMSSRQPSPVIAETANTGPFQRYALTNALIRAARSSSAIRSILFSTSHRGFA